MPSSVDYDNLDLTSATNIGCISEYLECDGTSICEVKKLVTAQDTDCAAITDADGNEVIT